MNRMRMITLLAIMALGAGSALGAWVYEAELTSDNVAGGSLCDGFGQATLIVNDMQTEAYLTVNFAGLDSPQIDAALLRAAAGEPGTVLLMLDNGSPLALTVEYTMEMMEAVDAGELAIQVSTEQCPNGAIRGDFAFVTVPVDMQTWSQVKTLFD